MGPLLGLISLLCGFCFLFGMPVIVAIFAWEDRRSRRFSTGLLAAVVMLVAFYISAGLIWKLGTADWDLSFLATVDAAGNAAKYGEPVEHRAERIVIWLLIYSTVAALFAGMLTAAVRHSWVSCQLERRRRRTKVRDNPGA